MPLYQFPGRCDKGEELTSLLIVGDWGEILVAISDDNDQRL